MKHVIKSGLLVAGIALGGTANAGFWGNTAHSRANCAGFNESVTWNAHASHYWRVESHHYNNPEPKPPVHILNSGMNLTWRAYAGHITEAYSTRGDNWRVAGYHFFMPNDTPNERERIDVITNAADCDIYDGWWD